MTDLRHIPAPGSCWNHRSGTEYTVICVTNVDATKAGYPVTVVYRDSKGAMWSRPLTEWHDSFIPSKVRAKDAGRTMMSAHAYCPTDLPHPDRMRWMADYFLAHYTGDPFKDHVIRETVNQLTDVARDFHAAGQLRARIADVITPILKPQQ